MYKYHGTIESKRMDSLKWQWIARTAWRTDGRYGHKVLEWTKQNGLRTWTETTRGLKGRHMSIYFHVSVASVASYFFPKSGLSLFFLSVALHHLYLGPLF